MTTNKAPKRRRYLLRAGLAVLVLLLVIQLVPYGRDHDNPPVLEEPAWDSPQTRATFIQACGDCHSNETKWPWYSNVAPVSWLVMHDVEDGRAVLNVSEWGRPENEGTDAAEEVQEGEMPQWYYVMMHPEAGISQEEKRAFMQGLVATFGQEGSENSHTREHDDDD